MSTFADKFTTGSRPTSTTFWSPITDSSARKYVTTNSVVNNNPVEATSNSEHIVKLAAGVKSVSHAVRGIAEEARKQASQAVDALLKTEAITDPKSPKSLAQFNESDVTVVQKQLSVSAADKFQKISDDNLRNALVRRTHDLVTNSRHSAIPIRMENMTVRTTNQYVPSIENVIVDLDFNNSALDNFYAELVINLPSQAAGNIRAIRIFRAELESPNFTRPLKPLSSHGLQLLQSFRGRKNQDNASMMVNRLQLNGIDNAVTTLNYIDPFTNQRVSAQNSEFSNPQLLIPPSLPGQTTVDRFAPPGLQHLDKSVLQNINVISNLQNNPLIDISPSLNSPIKPVGGFFRESSSGNVVVDSGNKLKFREIAIFSPDSNNCKTVGSFMEFRFVDESVSYGKGYKYFAVTVDDQIVQSARSQIVEATIEGLRVPLTPSNVISSKTDSSISLAMSCFDKLVEKFEIYRREENPNAAQHAIAQIISDQEGFSTSFAVQTAMANGFILVGEAKNSPKMGANFIDASATPGRPYTYRVYSVDIFGNKSESPFEIDVFIPDAEQQYVALKTPTIMAEVDVATHKMKLTFNVEDDHVQRMFIERRDLTIGEDSFTIPSTQSRIRLGYGRNPRKNVISMSGEMLFNSSLDENWQGFFMNTGQKQVFVDKTVQFDHIYQYRIYGEDRFGNRTSYALSTAVMIVRRPLINAPVGLKAGVSYDESANVQGVIVSWNPGSQDVHALELMGSQNNLNDTSVRTLYQVQRKRNGEDRWLSFPLMSGTSMTDPVLDGEPPRYRPPFLSVNETYTYRVQAVQTGTFISNFCDPVSVFVGYGMKAPANFSLRTPPVATSPFYVMLNWDSPQNSGVEDRWEIERAIVNNIAAATINMGNPESFTNLDYRPHRTVFRESSRFSSNQTDSPVRNDIIISEHHYLDGDVEFGNTYFYRIRSISRQGTMSKWSYKGIKITSAEFEKKYMPTVTDTEKQKLVVNRIGTSFISVDPTPLSSYSMRRKYFNGGYPAEMDE